MILGQLRMGARQAKNAPLAMVTVLLPTIMITKIHYDDENDYVNKQGCISCGPCSYPELTEDHVLPSA